MPALRTQAQAAQSVIVNVETNGLRFRQLIQPFLLLPGFLYLLFCLVFFEDALEGLKPLSFCHPALPIYLQVPFTVAHYLLLRINGCIQAAQKVLIVLPVRGTHTGPGVALVGVVLSKCDELAEAVQLFLKMLPGPASYLAET